MWYGGEFLQCEITLKEIFKIISFICNVNQNLKKLVTNTFEM
jgi:hypothetical protein